MGFGVEGLGVRGACDPYLTGRASYNLLLHQT